MRKTKRQLVEELSNGFDYDINALLKMPLDELQELYEELHNEDLFFPNGRDYDTEDEDGV